MDANARKSTELDTEIATTPGLPDAPDGACPPPCDFPIIDAVVICKRCGMIFEGELCPRCRFRACAHCGDV